MMSLIMEWAAQFRELLLTLGWWITAGLVLGTAMQILPLKRQNRRSDSGAILLALICGVLLPVCNFASIPLAATLWSCGVGMGAGLAFLSAATLLNPAGALSGWAYMGPGLTMAYILCAVIVSSAVGMAGRYFPVSDAQLWPELDRKSRIRNIWKKLAPELAVWTVLGIAAQALLMALMPEELWNRVLMDPKGTSFGQAAAAGIFRHVCIPDDVALAASLAATGLRPGCAVLFLLAGVCTNLPELFVLYGMAGKKTAAVYLGVTAAVSTAAAFATELVIGADFAPHFNLVNAETYTQMGNLLSIRTWMPARVPCAIGLLLLAGWGLWCRRRK